MYICLLPYLFVVLILLDVILTFYLYRTSSKDLEDVVSVVDAQLDDIKSLKNDYNALFYIEKENHVKVLDKIEQLQKEITKLKKRQSISKTEKTK